MQLRKNEAKRLVDVDVERAVRRVEGVLLEILEWRTLRVCPLSMNVGEVAELISLGLRFGPGQHQCAKGSVLITPREGPRMMKADMESPPHGIE
jgi:hypothetical protein